ncbi:MAG: OmpA family protein [Pseudomonadota bacterium]
MIGPGNLKKRRRDESEDWHLTLADMMTLLLCFFVVIVSASAVDLERYKLIAHSLQKTMGGQEKKDAAPAGEEPDLAAVHRNLKEILGPAVRDVALEWRRDGVAVNLPGEVFFELGRAELTERAHRVLTDISPALAAIPYRLTIEGHTDSTPIHSPRFPSNWELSAARAGSVGRFLIDRGFPKDKVEILGLADTRPILPNEDPQGRPWPENQARNRRVAIVVRP